MDKTEQEQLNETIEKKQKALAGYRELAKTNPALYLPEITATLNNLSILYEKAECLKEAETACFEALEISQKLAQTEPDKYLSEAALMFNNLGLLQRKSGRYQEAITNYSKALEIRENLAQKYPDIYTSEVTMTRYYLLLLKMEANGPDSLTEEELLRFVENLESDKNNFDLD